MTRRSLTLALAAVTAHAFGDAACAETTSWSCDAAGADVDEAAIFLQVVGSKRSAPAGVTVTASKADVVADTETWIGSLKSFKEGKIYKHGAVLKAVQGQDTTTLEVLQTRGGLLQAFKLNGRSIVFQRPRSDQLDGTSFWPGPQSAWGWPPPPAIDPVASKDLETAYDLSFGEDGKSFMLKSPVSHELNLQVSKKLSVDEEKMAFVVDYSIINVGPSPSRWAPWEISRVRPGGTTFFKTGGHSNADKLPDWGLQDAAGATWFEQTTEKRGKFFANTAASKPGSSKAWLAHTDGQVVLVKCFDQILQGEEVAPGEDQIEMYSGGDYEEVEEQGAYRLIKPSSSLDWRVLWFMRRLPAGATGKVGDHVLVDFVTDLCH